MLVSLIAVASIFLNQEPVMSHARGTFEVVITPVASYTASPANAHGRMILAKTFQGGLVATGEGEMLGLLGPDRSGAYVALERVRGSLDGREGEFSLVHRGVMDAGQQDLSITVVPGSGSGQLTGINGVFHLTIEGGVHRYDLEYSLPAAE